MRLARQPQGRTVARFLMRTAPAGRRAWFMSEDNLLTRREFTLESALAILSAATITISCGDDNNSSTTTPTPTPTTTDKNGTISANHGHVAVITAAQLTARNTISL